MVNWATAIILIKPHLLLSVVLVQDVRLQQSQVDNHTLAPSLTMVQLLVGVLLNLVNSVMGSGQINTIHFRQISPVVLERVGRLWLLLQEKNIPAPSLTTVLFLVGGQVTDLVTGVRRKPFLALLTVSEQVERPQQYLLEILIPALSLTTVLFLVGETVDKANLDMALQRIQIETALL